jgi:predicted transposase YdaD
MLQYCRLSVSVRAMAQPFDITLKHLLEAHPADCLRLVDLATNARIDVIDADLATVSAEADKVFRVNDVEPWLAHIESQVNYDASLPQRTLKYNVLLMDRHGLPVRTVVILLRPKADGPEMTGVVRRALAGEEYLGFHYRVVRIWRKPVEAVLAAGLGTLPLAPLAQLAASELPAVIRRMKERFAAEAARGEEGTLWAETYVLMGLRYDRAFAQELLKGVRGMEESLTYQEIIEKGAAKGRAEGIAKGKAEGRAEEAQQILLRLGTKMFGKPDATTKAAIAAIRDHEQLEALAEKVLEVNSWQELLAKPRGRVRNGRKRR